VTYDDWKCATPPEYERDESDPDERERARVYPGPPPSSVWVLFALDSDCKWDVEYAALTRDEAEAYEADVLRDDPSACTLLKEFEIVTRHPKAARADRQGGR